MYSQSSAADIGRKNPRKASKTQSRQKPVSPTKAQQSKKQQSKISSSAKKQALNNNNNNNAVAGSVTQSEHSSMLSDDQIYIDMPGTQHVPFRRNDGSLDLYSDGKVSGGKYSNDQSEGEDSSAAKELQ